MDGPYHIVLEWIWIKIPCLDPTLPQHEKIYPIVQRLSKLKCFNWFQTLSQNIEFSKKTHQFLSIQKKLYNVCIQTHFIYLTRLKCKSSARVKIVLKKDWIVKKCWKKCKKKK